jgi:rod shape-determining protein MreD
MRTYFRFAFIILCLVLLHTTFIPFISLGGYLPNIFILFLVYIAVYRGQIETTIFGFILGLMQDCITIKFFGLGAFSTTVAGFVVGFFFNENTIEQTIGSYRYVLLVGLCSLVHNIIYFTIFFQGSDNSVFFSMLELTFGMTLYTCVISFLPMFFFSRKYNISWAH